jgi:hypothetical protein
MASNFFARKGVNSKRSGGDATSKRNLPEKRKKRTREEARATSARLL